MPAEILHVLDVVAELRRHELVARIASGLAQFLAMSVRVKTPTVSVLKPARSSFSTASGLGSVHRS
jgi:hypothetical protein